MREKIKWGSRRMVYNQRIFENNYHQQNITRVPIKHHKSIKQLPSTKYDKSSNKASQKDNSLRAQYVRGIQSIQIHITVYKYIDEVFLNKLMHGYCC